MSPTIALATFAELPNLHDSDAALVQALQERGATVKPAVWDDPTVPWQDFDLVVIRSTWDYATRGKEFIAWARQVAEVTTLQNPADVLAWNLDKRYLLDLAEADIAIIPTTIIEPGHTIDHCPHLDQQHVVKPIIGAGALDSVRVAAGDRELTRTQVELIHASGRAALIQPFVETVNSYGEVDVICYDGVPSHAMHKPQVLPPVGVPMTGPIKVPVASLTQASPAEQELAAKALRFASTKFHVDTLLYGRVDMVLYQDKPAIIELEVAEPHMYFLEVPEAAPRYAERILHRVQQKSAAK